MILEKIYILSHNLCFRLKHNLIKVDDYPDSRLTIDLTENNETYIIIDDNNYYLDIMLWDTGMISLYFILKEGRIRNVSVSMFLEDELKTEDDLMVSILESTIDRKDLDISLPSIFF